MKKETMFFAIGMSIIIASCSNKSTNSQSSDKDSLLTSQEMVGNDKDEHGCKASAGYTWSEALQECIRVWEKGAAMKSLIDPQATSAGFIVFSKDSTEVELFLPEQENHALLQRMNPVSDPKKVVWSADKASNGLKVYQNADKLWIIEQDGKAQYQSVKK